MDLYGVIKTKLSDMDQSILEMYQVGNIIQIDNDGDIIWMVPGDKA